MDRSRPNTFMKENYIEGGAGHGGRDIDEDVPRTDDDGVAANKKGNEIVLKEIMNDKVRTALTPFDWDGDGTIDAEELRQAAKDHQTVLMSRKILAWFWSVVDGIYPNLWILIPMPCKIVIDP